MITTISSLIGIPTIIGCLIYIGKKIQILNELHSSIQKIKHNIKVISDSLIRSQYIEFDHTILEPYSPLRLTDKGKTYLDELGLIQIIKDNKKDFFEYIQSETPTTKLDVELAAMKAVRFLFDKPYFDSIKVHLYNHPEENFSNMTSAAGIFLRDTFLEEHQEIQQ